MKFFNNEWTRMQHPYANKIPRNIWNEYFSDGWSYAHIIPIMETHEANIIECLKNIQCNRYNKKQDFFLALVCGHPQLSIELFTETARILKASPDNKIIVAASLGRNDIVRTLLSNMDDQASLERLHSAAFIAAAANGHIEILQEILQHTTTEDRRKAFSSAAIGGHINVLQYLEENISKEELQELQRRIKATTSFTTTESYDCREFKDAASNGHLHVLKYLEEKISPKELQNMIRSNAYEAFELAALNGHIHVLRYLKEKLSPEDLQRMMQPNGIYQQYPLYTAYTNAAINGHIEIWEYLKSLIPKNEISNAEMHAYEMAVRNGHIDFLEHLTKTMPHDLLKNLQQEAFGTAADSGQVDVMRYMAEKIQNEKGAWQEIVDGVIDNGPLHSIFINLGYLNNPYKALDVLNYLITIDPEKIKNKIIEFLQSNDIDYTLARIAEQPHGNNILKYLDTQAHDEFMAAISSPEYAATIVRCAMSSGNMDTITFLEEKIPNIQEIIAQNNCAIFYHSLGLENENVTKHLLSYVNVFLSVELNIHFSSSLTEITNSYVDDLLAALPTEITRFGNEHPDETFDITNAEQAKKYFCVLLNLIKRINNGNVYYDSITLLLNIPAVKALALSTTNNDSQRNEIMHLVQIYNPDVIAILTQIPEFNDLIAHYHREVAPWIWDDETTPRDTQTIVQDRESSMRALTTEEQSRLQEAINRYMPHVQEKGVEHIINDLRHDLQSRYEKNPASIKITTNGKIHTVNLHFIREEFDALQLSPEHKKQALEEYYKHSIHTAFRYLSKPNPWIHQNATFVRAGGAIFEEYQELMALLYTAACDKNSLPIDDYTIETRVEEFARQLALINRAHNSDETRVKTDKNGKPVLDDSGKEVTEEYDDLEGDKPSCGLGVKARLFGSLQGHPLFIIVTEEKINEEIRDFARQHFSTKITAANKNILNTILNKVAAGEELDPTEENVIKSLDIENPVVTFNSLMQTKYGPRIMAADLQAHIQKSLVLKDGEHHLLRLLWVEPQQFFQPPAQATSAATGFFATSAEQSSTQTDNKNDHPSSCNSKKS